MFAALITGVFCILFACFAGDLFLLAVRGVKTEGVCTKLGWSKSSSGVKISASYTDLNGAQHTCTTGLRSGSPQVGDEVTVIYDRRSPRRSTVAPFGYLRLVGAALFTLVLGVLCWVFSLEWLGNS
ncbi:DUF3592 domain-containing protein [Streptomyces niveus]|uniref:DUF3592 domain-containing protein n=1 Tax=Streptomyces niveus TaxID=193462 RepID=UPI0034194C06